MLKRISILQEYDRLIIFPLLPRLWYGATFPLTFFRARQIGITSWQSTVSNMIEQHSL